MGCDIHAYCEYSSDGKYWRNLTANAGERNYVMFGVLAGVRCEQAKLFDPKGMPTGGIGYRTEEDYWVRVAPASHPEWAKMDGYTSRETAERWVQQGLSLADYTGDKLTRVSGPDWHSHSWLTTDELSQAIDHYRKVVGEFWPEMAGNAPSLWLMILAAMQAAEANGNQTRVVFWFDN